MCYDKNRTSLRKKLNNMMPFQHYYDKPVCHRHFMSQYVFNVSLEITFTSLYVLYMYCTVHPMPVSLCSRCAIWMEEQSGSRHLQWMLCCRELPSQELCFNYFKSPSSQTWGIHFWHSHWNMIATMKNCTLYNLGHFRRIHLYHHPN